MRSEEKKFMERAIEAAKKGIKKGQSPFGACIEKNGKIISCTNNQTLKNKDPTAHAEINAIRLACKKLKTIDLSECTIYSTAEPCPMCFSAIHWARIPKIVYGAGISDAKKAGFNELAISNIKMKKEGNLKIKIKKGFMKKECRMLFELWRKTPKSRAY